ncbi:hypothetical protein DNX69_08500 [Rhodopseudomonas palustris]|uniref:PAAR repeat-containing protein n=1 Tax=Rhodopseudomonas palustris TaxID=1076 RepID=A0A323UJD2_RHOPL|nr:hypothetical protein DNX69_08500 [Rhodopseudomonas palustris]
MTTPSWPTAADRPHVARGGRHARCLLAVVAALGTAPALAQAPGSGAPGVVTGGSGDVIVGGKPAARAGDTASDGTIVEGSSNVFINGKPAAIGGSRTGCGGVVVGSGSGVFINGKPVARTGDSTTNCK